MGDEIRLGQASSHVHSVRLFIVESDPSPEIAQHLKGVVSESITAIVVDAVTTELEEEMKSQWGSSSIQTSSEHGQQHTADTKLVMYARASGCTVSLLSPASSILGKDYKDRIECGDSDMCNPVFKKLTVGPWC